jgi:hypothetical protein
MPYMESLSIFVQIKRMCETTELRIRIKIKMLVFSIILKMKIRLTYLEKSLVSPNHMFRET